MYRRKNHKPSVWKLHCQCSYLKIQGETEKHEGKYLHLDTSCDSAELEEERTVSKAWLEDKNICLL